MKNILLENIWDRFQSMKRTIPHSPLVPKIEFFQEQGSAQWYEILSSLLKIAISKYFLWQIFDRYVEVIFFSVTNDDDN